MTAADWSVERVITDHAVEVHVHYPFNPLRNGLTLTLTQQEARDYADVLNAAARDADLCRCGHRLAAWGELCSVCSEANEPPKDAA